MLAEYRIKHTPDALLFRAIDGGSREEVAYWLRRGANPNAIGAPSQKSGVAFWLQCMNPPLYPDETTPLMHAADSPEITQILLSSGADPRLSSGESLLFATRRNDVAAARLLLKTPFPSSTLQSSLSEAAVCGYADFFPILLEAGAKINGGNQYGVSPLFDAISGGRRDAAERLIGLGADINQPDAIGGQTPLIRAALANSAEDVGWLLKHGAKANLRDKEGRTALYYARKRIWERSPSARSIPPPDFITAAEILRQAGATE